MKLTFAENNEVSVLSGSEQQQQMVEFLLYVLRNYKDFVKRKFLNNDYTRRKKKLVLKT